MLAVVKKRGFLRVMEELRQKYAEEPVEGVEPWFWESFV